MRYLRVIGLLVLFLHSLVVLAKDIEIALVKDGTSQADFLSESQIRQEILDLLSGEFTVRFTHEKETTADWSINSVNTVLQKLYQNPDVDIIVTLGAISSSEVSKRSPYPKPTIAAVTLDPSAQALPLKINTSGQRNFTYIAENKKAGHEIVFFRDFVGKRNISILAEPLLLESWPELKGLLNTLSSESDMTFDFVAITESPESVVASIPQDTEAVIVGILSQYSQAQVERLAQALIKRKLPSYTFNGETGVRSGFLVSNTQLLQMQSQIARRIATNIQRMLLGADAGDMPVFMQFNPRTVYNEATGLAIGFAPKWADIIDAKVLAREQQVVRKAFSIPQAITFALVQNLDLRASAIDVNLASKDIRLAQSNLLPGVSVGAGYTQIKESQAIPGVNPERRTDAQLSVSQLLYSESAWANYDISKFLLENQDAVYQAQVLDTIQAVASSYLNLLRSKADEEIRLSNLEVTRRNLELSENRLRIGSSGQSDVLRWRSQLANNRRNLFASEASRRNAELELARVLNLPPDVLVDVKEPKVGSILNILTDKRFERYVANEIQWQAFQSFYKQEAIENAPELKSFDSRLKINAREYQANKRGYFIPDISLVGQVGENLNQSGFGAIDDAESNSWNVGIQATLPLDLNGQRRTTASRKTLEKEQLRLQREATEQRILINTGQALYNVGSSFPSIELAQLSASAASESLELVRDAYAKGSVPISDLLDAQNNALSAQLQAADAEYSFLQDYVQLMRSAGDFKPLLDGRYSVTWFERLLEHFRSQGIDVDALGD
ncbi:TolC family protein [Marinicella sp. W31]|uniref:TolC family protein n=1 Tax=Marinicella sp. W31 TaxID=3023713 RepID=UPI0037563E45